MNSRNFFLISILILCLSSNVLSLEPEPFNHQHQVWNELLLQHVHYDLNGFSSKLDYKQMLKQQGTLNIYLAKLSKVSQDEFFSWSQNQQKAFLINAYNAFTVKLILTRYPNLESIKDLGSFFRSPWKQQFFTLLGKSRSLDDVEHKLLRQPSVYDDPYIHFAVVCASIGCPALRNEAYIADKIDQQLKDNLRRFLSDKSRNRYNVQTNSLEVSKIFDWYEEDFTKGYKGINSLKEFFSLYGKHLSNDKNIRQLIIKKRVNINFTDYDWRLNDL